MRFVLILGLLMAAAIACGGGESPVRTLGIDVSFEIEGSSNDLKAVANYLRDLDADAEMMKEGSTPPIFHVKLRADEPCRAIRFELEARADIRGVVCRDADRTYGAGVRFKPESTELSDIDEVEQYLMALSDDAGLLSEDSLPPIFHATWSTDEDSPCTKVRSDLESRAYILEVECRRIEYVPYGTPFEPE